MLIRYVLFSNIEINYLVFKNNDGLFIGLYAIDLVDKNEVELFIKNKIRTKTY